MIDIWEEKPRPKVVEWFPYEILEYRFHLAYRKPEMDAWLVRIKEYLDNTMEINRKQFHEIGRLEKELHGLATTVRGTS